MRKGYTREKILHLYKLQLVVKKLSKLEEANKDKA